METSGRAAAVRSSTASGTLRQLAFRHDGSLGIGAHGAADAAIAEAHAVAGLHGGDSLAHGLHHAHAVMAQHEGLRPDEIAAKLAEEDVGGVERRGPQSDQHVVRARAAMRGPHPAASSTSGPPLAVATMALIFIVKPFAVAGRTRA